MQPVQYKHVQSVWQQGSLYTVTLYTKALGLTTKQSTINMQTPSKRFGGSKWESLMEVFYRVQTQTYAKK